MDKSNILFNSPSDPSRNTYIGFAKKNKWNVCHWSL